MQIVNLFFYLEFIIFINLIKKKWGSSGGREGSKSSADIHITAPTNIEKLYKPINQGKVITVQQICDHLNVSRGCAYKVIGKLLEKKHIEKISQHSRLIYKGVAGSN